MQIMCLNGWGGTCHKDLLPYLADEQPDILCLQEVVHSPQTDRDWLTYRDGDHVLPQRANFFHEVCQALPDHSAFFCPAAQGTLWDGDVATPSQWGLATFVHHRIPVVGQVQGFVHKTYSPDGFGAHPRSRSAHGIRVHDRARSGFVSVTHMHGLRDLAGKSDSPARRDQAMRLRDLSNALSEPGDLRVVCGDFNVEPGSETFDILATAGLTDLVVGRGFAGTRTSHYPKPGRFADYMLINRVDAVRNFRVIARPEVSDHCPMVLDL